MASDLGDVFKNHTAEVMFAPPNLSLNRTARRRRCRAVRSRPVGLVR